MDHRNLVASKTAEIKKFHETMLKEVSSSTKSKLIASAQEIVAKIKELETGDLFSEHILEKSLDFETGLLPPLDVLQFTLKNYSSQGSDPVFSEFLVTNGLKWRLKIYPFGSGESKNVSLSVYLELTDGLQEPGKYFFRIEMLNKDKMKNVSKEATGHLIENGESLGFRSFVGLAELQNGFVCDDNVIFRLSIRPESYQLLARDQQNYIVQLEKALINRNDTEEGEIVDIKEIKEVKEEVEKIEERQVEDKEIEIETKEPVVKTKDNLIKMLQNEVSKFENNYNMSFEQENKSNDSYYGERSLMEDFELQGNIDELRHELENNSLGSFADSIQLIDEESNREGRMVNRGNNKMQKLLSDYPEDFFLKRKHGSNNNYNKMIDLIQRTKSDYKYKDLYKRK